jgi:hypothetical protein
VAAKGSSETKSVEEAGTITPPFQFGAKSTEAKTSPPSFNCSVEVPSSLLAPSVATDDWISTKPAFLFRATRTTSIESASNVSASTTAAASSHKRKIPDDNGADNDDDVGEKREGKKHKPASAAASTTATTTTTTGRNNSSNINPTMVPKVVTTRQLTKWNRAYIISSRDDPKLVLEIILINCQKGWTSLYSLRVNIPIVEP